MNFYRKRHDIFPAIKSDIAKLWHPLIDEIGIDEFVRLVDEHPLEYPGEILGFKWGNPTKAYIPKTLGPGYVLRYVREHMESHSGKAIAIHLNVSVPHVYRLKRKVRMGDK